MNGEGMAEVIAAHGVYGMSAGTHTACRCNREWVPHSEYRVHLTEELAKAGFGNVQEALLTAADEMEQERSTRCLDDSGRHWIARTLNDLRRRANANDPEGRALVQAIHDRKTGQ